MPLLSLPSELLLDIIRETLATPASTTPSCCDRARHGHSCTPRNTTSLAHTCQLLRYLTLPFMYASVTAHLTFTPTLHALLTSDVNIARCIRHLIVFITDASGAQLLHGIIRSCMNLQDLCLDGSHSSVDFAATLLLHVCPQPQLSLGLRCFTWGESVRYLSSAPPGLHTVRLEEPTIPRAITPVPDSPTASIMPVPDSPTASIMPVPHPPTAAVLSGVRKLVYHTTHLDNCEPDNGTPQPSDLMPNVSVLDLHITDFKLPLLGRYTELGTRLTELTMHFRSTPVPYCGAVAALAPSLRRFVAHGGNMCEVLFAADWACVEYVDVVCLSGCDRVQVAATREALMKLVFARPAARVLVQLQGSTELVRWEGGAGNVASLEAFEELDDDEFCCTFGLCD